MKASKNPRKQSLLRQKKMMHILISTHPHYILFNSILGALFVCGIMLTVIEIDIYRLTFIHVEILIAIWIISGVIVTPIFRNFFNIYFNQSPREIPIVFHVLYNIPTFGGIVIFLFMWTNYHYAKDDVKTITRPIQSSGWYANTRRGCGSAYAYIQYQDLKKELIFPCRTEIKKYDVIYIETAKGFWGFDIILSRSLLKNQW